MRYFIFFLLFISTQAFSQITDDFSDGDFTNNPTWYGDVTEFQISNYSNSTWSLKPRLQLNGVSAGISHLYLVTPMANLNNKQWEFWARLSLNTSKTNNARVYLVSDQPNLEGNLNGYYVMFGDDNNDQLDSLSLWKQTGSVTEKLIAGHIAYTNVSRNYRVKVTRDNTGLWSLYVDTLGQTNYKLEGTATDLTHNASGYFGVFCRYTSSNKTNFYFDDIYVGGIVADTIPPSMISLDVISQNQIDVYFSENLESSSAQNILNYSVIGIGNPAYAVLDGSNASLVHLAFTTPFASGVSYQLLAQNVMDLSLNAMPLQSLPFAWYVAQKYDIVINEIMADPDPPVGLPNCEYVELYNRTALPISLKNWIFETGSTTNNFPDVTLGPQSYLIVAHQNSEADLVQYGNVVGFSSFSLTNTGNTVNLKNPSGNLIHSISYTDKWYQDASKSGGGWSLEQIDPANPCGEAQNWIASTDIKGGTPGAQNSVFAPNPDNTPPVIKSCSPLNYHVLQVIFNEIIRSENLSQTTQYHVDNSIGNPSAISISPDNKKVTLSFDSAFKQNVIYTLTITDTLEDCVGNYTYNATKSFSLYQPRQFEIQINEIMADPDPVVGLPNYEYVELYNRTNFPVSLRKWSFVSGTTSKIIPDITIDPLGYLIITAAGAAPSFTPYGNTVEISGLSLTNTGATLSVLDSLSRVISTVTYSDQWYGSSAKANGGWSLEQIDPANPCGESSNWKASNDALGGTPGKINSVYQANPDNKIPALIRASVNRNHLNKVRLFFSEPIDSVTLKNPLKYEIDNSVGNPVSVKLVPPSFKSVILNLAADLQYGITYRVTLKDTLRDCAGNLMITPVSVKFAVPYLPDSADVVINEILSNPKGNGVDYIELYNRSQKVFDLSELFLAAWDKELQQITALYNIAPDGFLIFPGEYVACTKNAAIVKSQYYTPNPDGFAEMSSIPSYNNDEGTVILCLQNQDIIDMMVYSADMHYPLLNSTDGVALERIHYNRPASDKTNWHSAAESVGFGTPAYINSQFSEATGDDGAVTVSPEIFSPDNDGYNDVLNIAYRFDNAGYVANIVIYDASGRTVRKLIKNELLGTTGIFSWDGITDAGEKANIGIYILYFEAFDLQGKVKKYKRTFVLATRFK